MFSVQQAKILVQQIFVLKKLNPLGPQEPLGYIYMSLETPDWAKGVKRTLKAPQVGGKGNGKPTVVGVLHPPSLGNMFHDILRVTDMAAKDIGRSSLGKGMQFDFSMYFQGD